MSHRGYNNPLPGKRNRCDRDSAWDLASHSVKGKGLLLSNWCGENLIGEESKALAILSGSDRSSEVVHSNTAVPSSSPLPANYLDKNKGLLKKKKEEKKILML